MREQFKPIENHYPYEISTLGRLKRNGKILSTPISTVGYCRKYLKDLKTNLSIHKSVAIAFIPNPCGHPEVNHINGIKTDNRVENLEWCTSSYNQKHSISIGLKTVLRGEQCGRSKLTSYQVLIIKEALNQFTQKEIAKYFNLNQSTISLIKTGKNWASC